MSEEEPNKNGYTAPKYLELCLRGIPNFKL